MGDYAHITSWGGVRVGREQQALELWSDALTLYEKAKANGQIEDYDTMLFTPSGGALPNGIIALWGTAEQVDAFGRDADRLRLQARAMVLLDDLVESNAVRGGALLEMMGIYTEVTGSLR